MLLGNLTDNLKTIPTCDDPPPRTLLPALFLSFHQAHLALKTIDQDPEPRPALPTHLHTHTLGSSFFSFLSSALCLTLSLFTVSSRMPHDYLFFSVFEDVACLLLKHVFENNICIDRITQSCEHFVIT